MSDARNRSEIAPDAETERVRRIFDAEAPRYDRQIRVMEWLLFAGGREWVCSRAQGDVLEIAIGTGRNLPLYPESARVTGVELSPAMLDVARGRARDHGRKVDLRVGDAQALDFPDQSFDCVVSTLSLCTIPDPRKAVAEARRVLRPGGSFRLLEHVRSPRFGVRMLQHALQPVFCRFGGDNLLREPLEPLEAAGFVVEVVERSKLGIVERIQARRPE